MATKYTPTRSNIVVRRTRQIYASDEEQRAAALRGDLDAPFRGIIEAMGPLLTGPAGRDSDPKVGSEIVFTLYTTLEKGPGYDLLLVNFADVQAVVTDEGPKIDAPTDDVRFAEITKAISEFRASKNDNPISAHSTIEAIARIVGES